MKIKTSIKIKAYRVIADAVDIGITTGWAHAHKHGENMDAEYLQSQIYDAVMLQLAEVLDFDDA